MGIMKQVKKAVVMAVAFVLVLPVAALAAPPGSTVTYTPDYSHTYQYVYKTAEGINSATASASKSGLLEVTTSANCTTVPLCQDTTAQGTAMVMETYRAKKGVPVKAIATFRVTESSFSGGPDTYGGKRLALYLASGGERITCSQTAPQAVSPDAPVTVVVECTLSVVNDSSVRVDASAASYTFDDVADSSAATSRLSATLVSLQVGPQQ